MPSTALILVDIQNDFMPDGALPVPDGYDVVPVANALMQQFELVVATQDWHPPDHGSFASQHDGKDPGESIVLNGLDQTLWPDHCVQHTEGAEFVDGLDTDRIDAVFQKGTDPEVDSYSGFFDNDRRRDTGMADYLRERGVETVYVAGVATDYCVKYTVGDATRLGFETYVVGDGCRGVDLNPGDVDQAMDAMEEAGATLVESSEVP